MRHLGMHMRIGLAAALACCAAALAPAMASADVSDLLPAVSPPGANDFTLQADGGAPGAGRARARHLRGRGRQLGDRLAEVQGRRLLRLRARVRQPRHRRHRRVGRPAGALRRRGARRHRSAPGLAGRPLAGRDDAALLPQVPGRRRQGRRPRRPRALQPRHHNPGRARRGRDVLPRVRPAARRLGRSSRTSTRATRPRAPSPTPQIETRYDEVVTPYTSAFLAPGPRTANILLQDACPAEVIDHHEMPNDGLAIRWALQALGRPGPADPTHPPSCT